MTEKLFSIQGNVEHFTIADIAKENRDFRKVLWTGQHSQASSLIAVIALFTAGSMRTVTETSAPARSAAAMVGYPKNALSARNSSGPCMVAAMRPKLANASATRRFAPLLAEVGSHVWRATLNTLYLDAIPDAIRAAYFGHDAEVNRTAYTDTADTADTSGLLAASRARRRSD